MLFLHTGINHTNSACFISSEIQRDFTSGRSETENQWSQNQSHGYAAKVSNTMSTSLELTAIGPRKRSKPQKFIDVQGQDFALVRNGSCGNSSNGASVIEKPNAKSDIYADEILRRTKKQSVATVAECVARNEATLEIVKNEVCHICHNRKESGITFHCGRHSYCDYHTATRLSFRVKDYDKKNPTVSFATLTLI